MPGAEIQDMDMWEQVSGVKLFDRGLSGIGSHWLRRLALMAVLPARFSGVAERFERVLCHCEWHECFLVN